MNDKRYNFDNLACGLIAAHPGHEGLLYGWLELAKPHVFILSDGSGVTGKSRLEYSRTLIRAAAALEGVVFGGCSDRRWYQSMLEGDINLFTSCQDEIFAAAAANKIRMIVTDPVEFYNPLHDLANAMAHGVAERLSEQKDSQTHVWTYEIVRSRRHDADSLKIRLDKEQSARKLSAAESYSPLSSEVREFEEQLHADNERLFADDAYFDWPIELGFEPYYEEVGRKRTLQGKYEKVITYREHVRPIALSIGAGQ